MTSRPALIALAVATLILIWGSTWSVISIGLEGVPPLTGIALRFALASILLLLLAHRQGVSLGVTSRERHLWWVNGLLTFSISYGVVYWAEQWIPSGLAAILFATFPLFVAVLAHWMLPDEPLTWRSLAGSLLALIGVSWIFAGDLAALGGVMIVPAALLMLLSPMASAVANVAVKKWGEGLHPLSLTAVPMGLCAILMGSLAWFVEADREILWNLKTVGAILYLAVMGSAVTFTVYFWLLGLLPATRLSLIALGVPIVALLIGVLFRREPVNVGMLGGTTLVLAGVALNTLLGGSRPVRPGSAEST